MSLLLSVAYVNAQDTRFSQPLNNPLALNPAMMALSNDVRLSLTYRNQWATIQNGYTTYAGTFTCPIFLSTKSDTSGHEFGKSRLDVGLNIIDDKSGGFNRISANVALAYTLKLNIDNSVSAALNIGLVQYSFGAMNQSFDEQYQYGAYNAQLPTGENIRGNKAAPDVGLGFMYLYAPQTHRIQFFAGLSGFHVNEPNMTLLAGNGKLPSRFDFQAGVKVIGNKMDFTPVVLYDFQGPFKQFIGGLLAAYKFGHDDTYESKAKLIIGAWYKQGDAIVVQGGFEYKIIAFTYSYDFGISQLTHVTPGLMTHEITLAFKLYEIGRKKGITGPSFL